MCAGYRTIASLERLINGYRPIYKCVQLCMYTGPIIGGDGAEFGGDRTIFE